MMATAKEISQHIDSLPTSKPFTASAFRHFGKTVNIRKILSRLVKSGEIVRLTHGVYCKPKHVPLVGKSLPSIKEIAQTIAATTGETLLIHGAEAARQLELSTQVPMRLVFYTSGNSRELTIANRTVTLKHVNPSQLICAGSIAGTIISALKYLGREHTNVDTIKHIAKRLTPQDFNEVLNNVSNMPAWIADLFYLFQQEQHLSE